MTKEATKRTVDTPILNENDFLAYVDQTLPTIVAKVFKRETFFSTLPSVSELTFVTLMKSSSYCPAKSSVLALDPTSSFLSIMSGYLK